MIHFETALEIPFSIALLEQAIHAALENQSAEGDLTLVLTDDKQLHDLNWEYLGIDTPTDVLSFPASETDPETNRRYLGDILLSIPRAEAQAQAAGHSLADEARLLVIHGVLHLLGHDHAREGEKKRMWKAQAEILERLGLGHVTVRDE